jgi:N-acetylglucosaminyldiphosphoundecaprenol N-acetyl-beta-D-mannosaminyltransferase
MTHQNSSRSFAHVLGVTVDALNMDSALDRIAALLRKRQKGYVCVTGVHGVMEAQHSSLLAKVYASAELNLPDGTPLTWVGRLQGHRAMSCVTGPDLMIEIFRRSEFSSFTHFFYGGVEGVALELQEKFTRDFPHVRIVGAAMPPFGDLCSREQKDLIATIADLKPDIIWVGLGCPKQEVFMFQYLPLLDTRLMFGVGAAFDFHTGRIRPCAPWIKRVGLHWLHRLIQNPRRLWRRNLFIIPTFLLHITLQFSGLRRYCSPRRKSSVIQPHAEVR